MADAWYQYADYRSVSVLEICHYLESHLET